MEELVFIVNNNKKSLSWLQYFYKRITIYGKKEAKFKELNVFFFNELCSLGYF